MTRRLPLRPSPEEAQRMQQDRMVLAVEHPVLIAALLMNGGSTLSATERLELRAMSRFDARPRIEIQASKETT